MQLDNLTIEIRPRRPWEAADLGMLMARRWWWQLTQVWIVLTLPLFIVLAFLPSQWLWLQAFLLWWLKPLFERPLLMILSQTVFGEYPATRDVLRAFPKLAVIQWLPSLTWRRLSPSRSMDLPVIQLEGLKGSARSERLSILHREGTSPASALTVFGIHIESFITLAIVSLVIVFVPSEINIDWLQLYKENDDRWFTLLFNLFTYISAALIAPFYVATGFALYLNRRVRLEAWDIEIAFRRMVNRRRDGDKKSDVKPGAGSSIMAAITMAFMLFAAGDDAIAKVSEAVAEAPQSNAYATSESARDLIQEIKRGDEFNVRDTHRYIHFESDEEDSDADMDLSWLESLHDFFSTLASIGEVVLWIVALLIILIIVLSYRHWLIRYRIDGEVQNRRRSPSTLFGLEVTQESLPDDVGTAARQAWLQGDKRGALALLYRACLFQLIDRGIELRDGDTEGVCLRKTRRALGQKTDSTHHVRYFESLTGLWQRFAYGHITPADDDVLQLCSDWNSTWSSLDEAQRVTP